MIKKHSDLRVHKLEENNLKKKLKFNGCLCDNMYGTIKKMCMSDIVVHSFTYLILCRPTK